VSRTRIENLPENCKLMVDSSLELPKTRASVFKFPFLKTARKINRFSVGIVALAVLIHYSKMFPMEALEKAISEHQNPKIAEINLQALEAGAKLY
jgi:Pyruvate/2-oxoacid:ferredoxin oxidoreductase gamma subunit